jgi:NADPH:quinone reductase-like Zn-dependent oxidoreductase
MPAVGDEEVLVRVQGASVNAPDWHFMRGTPYLVRMLAGMSRPRASASRLGADMAGSVEAVGKNVTDFRPGDEVFGGLEDRGTLAEYISVRQDGMILQKPAGLTFEQAASVPVPAVTALQARRTARMALLSPAMSQRMVSFLAHQNKADLAVLRELLETGKVTPVIDRTYPLSQVAEAIGYLEQGHATGKVAITV